MTKYHKTKQQKAKQQKKLVEGYIAQMANEAQTEENNEKKKKDNIQIFPSPNTTHIYYLGMTDSTLHGFVRSTS